MTASFVLVFAESGLPTSGSRLIKLEFSLLLCCFLLAVPFVRNVLSSSFLHLLMLPRLSVTYWKRILLADWCWYSPWVYCFISLLHIFQAVSSVCLSSACYLFISHPQSLDRTYHVIEGLWILNRQILMQHPQTQRDGLKFAEKECDLPFHSKRLMDAEPSGEASARILVTVKTTHFFYSYSHTQAHSSVIARFPLSFPYFVSKLTENDKRTITRGKATRRQRTAGAHAPIQTAQFLEHIRGALKLAQGTAAVPMWKSS